MRWSTRVRCPRRGCDGILEACEPDQLPDPEKPYLKVKYLFFCSHCNFHGEWSTFARSRTFRK